MVEDEFPTGTTSNFWNAVNPRQINRRSERNNGAADLESMGIYTGYSLKADRRQHLDPIPLYL